MFRFDAGAPEGRAGGNGMIEFAGGREPGSNASRAVRVSGSPPGTEHCRYRSGAGSSIYRRDKQRCIGEE